MMYFLFKLPQIVSTSPSKQVSQNYRILLFCSPLVSQAGPGKQPISSLPEQPSSFASWFRSNALGLFLTVILSSCALIPDPPPSARTYLLAPPLPQQKVSSSSELTLLISPPRAAAGYTSNRMAYTRRSYELGYFSHHEWVDTPVRMLAPILVNALESSGHFRSVAPSHIHVQADLQLETEILRLVQDFSIHPSEGQLILQARIIDLSSGQEIAHRIFETRKKAPTEEPYGGVIALNQALGDLLRELATFCVQAYARHTEEKETPPLLPHTSKSHATDLTAITEGH